MVLPRYVAFKSKADELYLKYIKEDQIHGYVKYNAHDVVSPYTNPDWIWVNSTDTTTKILYFDLALRNLGNNNFCKSLTADNKTNCLNAAVPTITTEARLEIQELVLSRNIYNLTFHLLDARIYEHIITMANGDATDDSNEANTIDTELSYTIF
ncbi:unnamed protein product [Citrullus colocynthis]|uniref:Agglutinin domain-containing protein n=1 Tax=Citrullus colocynthis TaxID=252529 RepID=A0ABP0YIH6_9ROSI